MTGTGVKALQLPGHASSGPATPRLLAKRYFGQPLDGEEWAQGEFGIQRKGVAFSVEAKRGKT